MRSYSLLVTLTTARYSHSFMPSSMAFRVGIMSSSNAEKQNTEKLDTRLYSSEEGSNEEGASLAADFSKLLQDRNIKLDESDLREMDDDEEELMDEEDVDDVTLSDDQVHRELDGRVLETAGGFVDLLSAASDEDDEDANPKVYQPPTTVPDSSLTAGDVVLVVLEALNHNDVPSSDRGIEILFGYSSPGSSVSQAKEIEGMSAAEYGSFLKDEYEYKILFNHEDAVIEKGDYSFDNRKAFFTAKLKARDTSDFISVNFILSTQGDDDACWLIDSLLIRPEGMRRRRRR
jgi:hypothetical protein